MAEDTRTDTEKVVATLRKTGGTAPTRAKLLEALRSEHEMTRPRAEAALSYLIDTVGWVAEEGKALRLVNDPEHPSTGA